VRFFRSIFEKDPPEIVFKPQNTFLVHESDLELAVSLYTTELALSEWLH
jgi:hypothetical protein